MIHSRLMVVVMMMMVIRRRSHKTREKNMARMVWMRDVAGCGSGSSCVLCCQCRCRRRTWKHVMTGMMLTGMFQGCHRIPSEKKLTSGVVWWTMMGVARLAGGRRSRKMLILITT